MDQTAEQPTQRNGEPARVPHARRSRTPTTPTSLIKESLRVYNEAQPQMVDFRAAIEYYYRKDPDPSSRREECARWGIIYVWDENEEQPASPRSTGSPRAVGSHDNHTGNADNTGLAASFSWNGSPHIARQKDKCVCPLPERYTGRSPPEELRHSAAYKSQPHR